MKRLVLWVAWGGLMLAGCGAGENAGGGAPPGRDAAAQPAGQANDARPDPESDRSADPDGPKTPIVRSLLDAIDDADAEDGDVRDDLRQILRESDDELSRVLGDHPRQSIERANQKAPVPVVGQP